MVAKEEGTKWWKEDWTHELGLFILGVVGVAAIWKLGAADAKTIAIATITGVAGVITGKKLNGNGGGND